jgi:hypothetical protein
LFFLLLFLFHWRSHLLFDHLFSYKNSSECCLLYTMSHLL